MATQPSPKDNEKWADIKPDSEVEISSPHLNVKRSMTNLSNKNCHVTTRKPRLHLDIISTLTSQSNDDVRNPSIFGEAKPRDLTAISTEKKCCQANETRTRVVTPRNDSACRKDSLLKPVEYKIFKKTLPITSESSRQYDDHGICDQRDNMMSQVIRLDSFPPYHWAQPVYYFAPPPPPPHPSMEIARDGHFIENRYYYTTERMDYAMPLSIYPYPILTPDGFCYFYAQADSQFKQLSSSNNEVWNDTCTKCTDTTNTNASQSPFPMLKRESITHDRKPKQRPAFDRPYQPRQHRAQTNNARRTKVDDAISSSRITEDTKTEGAKKEIRRAEHKRNYHHYRQNRKSKTEKKSKSEEEQ